MTTKLLIQTDASGKATYGIAPSVNMKSIFLDQDNAEPFTVPTDFKFYELHFSIDPGLRVWISYNGVAAEYPAAATWADTNSELNPGARVVPGGSIISAITPDTSAQLGVAMYGIG
jgi:hypothetical protein